MLRPLKTIIVLASFSALLVSLGCDLIESVGGEEKILTPPPVGEIIETADKLGLKPKDLLERRRQAALRELDEFYQEQMDEALTDRAIRRLERQLERSRSKLEENYDLRKDRLQQRLERESGG